MVALPRTVRHLLDLGRRAWRLAGFSFYLGFLENETSWFMLGVKIIATLEW